MVNYKLNLISNEYYKDGRHIIKNFANKLPLKFNGTTYTGDKHGNSYKKGRFSLFLKPKGKKNGYKIFVGFRKADRLNDHIKNYPKDSIINVKKVYDILSPYGLSPIAYHIFSVNISIFGCNYLSYGLEIQNIVKKGKGTKSQFRDFKRRLKKVCKSRGLRRLDRRDRKSLLQGENPSGTISNIMYEASTKADNVIFDGKNYILLDIDPMWTIL